MDCYGGRSDKVGADALCPVFNCGNIPVEVHETNNPVLIHRLSLIPDSAGGTGKFRGGCGLRKDIELLADDATVVLLGDRHKTPPYGVFGGKPGTPAQTVLLRHGEEIQLGSKEVRHLRRGDIISFRRAGGYGDPRQRSRDAVERDVLDGFISKDMTDGIHTK